ncbi:putative signal transducing protein [Gillisia sp. Hel_I_86]|uniref:putative signal transducing protein n=1 Tax=Gillisia sp. Hel_I_86 TaxID=1249981 RepID=UPI00119C0FFE|nr:DUF2007 domain-containing protein [Gillisia sp. Hel_I_86]TVZ26505.1 putative signal transducing protein [Gillisia sp. Hel_I_86]
MNFITVYNSNQSFQIAIVKNLFDNENINYRIPDEFLDSAAGIGGLGITGMRVQVIEEDGYFGGTRPLISVK